jgi:uncharacterized protein YceK
MGLSLRRWAIVCTASVLVSQVGCGTILNMGAGTCPIRDHPIIYGGVGIDVEYLATQDFPLGLFLALLDFPLSLVGDTITLPWSIPATITQGIRNAPAEEDAKPSRRDP